MKNAIFVAVTIALSSCTAQWHLKQAIAKEPSILTSGQILQEVRDTIVITTDAVQLDTVADFQKDTVLVDKENASVKLLIDTLLKTVYVEVQCDADTVYVETITEQVVLQPEIRPSFNWRTWIAVGCVGLLLLGVVRVFGK